VERRTAETIMKCEIVQEPCGPHTSRRVCYSSGFCARKRDAAPELQSRPLITDAIRGALLAPEKSHEADE
jgi:hypothetical protein